MLSNKRLLGVATALNGTGIHRDLSEALERGWSTVARRYHEELRKLMKIGDVTALLGEKTL